jgi:hypothetical protein
MGEGTSGWGNRGEGKDTNLRSGERRSGGSG